MNRLLSLAAALALQAAIATPVALAQASVKLNLVPLPSVRQQVDLTMDTRMNMSMRLPENAPEQARAEAEQLKAAMPMTMTMAMRQTLSTSPKAADGSYTLEAEMATLKSEMRNAAGQPQALPPPMTFRFTARLKDDQFEQIDMQLPAAAASQALSKELQEQIFNQSFDWMRKFNGVTLKVGESVEVPVEMNLPMGASKQLGKVLGRYTLTGVRQGVASFDVAVTMAMDVALPVSSPASAASAPAATASGPTDLTAPAPAASAPAEVKGSMTANGSGKMDIRLADRLMLRSTMSMTMGMDMAGPQGKLLRMDTQMTMASTGKALPAAKKKTAPAKPATKG
ncbi:hypothetical protein CS062_24560 [Roseateles chitinivorans]|uniref:Uncharacterized protein n=1 Tax=Roseateles chitinivorans TaxID=2917965 RepID=A0A2G9C4F6_9BURK|nr:hypothetical protein [Roseateles chitinivorans]PIM50524.1 hypothetical protein CS062_24560 [Roseateles chitinivorans]